MKKKTFLKSNESIIETSVMNTNLIDTTMLNNFVKKCNVGTQVAFNSDNFECFTCDSTFNNTSCDNIPLPSDLLEGKRISIFEFMGIAIRMFVSWVYAN